MQKILDGQVRAENARNKIAGGINEINIMMGKMTQQVDVLKPLMKKVGDLATQCERMEDRLTVLEASIFGDDRGRKP